jgi:hypothetical protein
MAAIGGADAFFEPMGAAAILAWSRALRGGGFCLFPRKGSIRAQVTKARGCFGFVMPDHTFAGRYAKNPKSRNPEIFPPKWVLS